MMGAFLRAKAKFTHAPLIPRAIIVYIEYVRVCVCVLLRLSAIFPR